MSKWNLTDTDKEAEFFNAAAAFEKAASDDLFDDPIKLLEWLADCGDAPKVEAVSKENSRSLSAEGDPYRTAPSTSRPAAGLQDGEAIDKLTTLRPVLRKRLKAEGILTIEQLCSVPKWKLLRMPGFGQGKVNEIEVALAKYQERDRDWEKSNEEPPSPGATELDLLKAARLEFVDNRQKGGALWVVGDRSIAEALRPLKQDGFFFYYKPEGSVATNHRSAWWTRAGSRAIDAAGNSSNSEHWSTAHVAEKQEEQPRLHRSASCQSILVRSKTTGEARISVKEVVYARPYGPSTAIDTYDNWYVCPMGFLQFSKYLEGSQFAFLTSKEGLARAVRIDAVTKVMEAEPGCFELYVELADEILTSVGKPLGWYIDAFGREKVLSAQVVETDDSSLDGSDASDEEAYVTSPELVGMLYGIACDGVVNIREARMLRKWLSTVEDADNRAVREIKELLEKVLDDDVVTAEEEREMLDLFNKIAGIVEEE